MIDSFVDDEIFVYSSDVIRELAAIEIQFQVRAILRAQSIEMKFDLDVIGDVLQGVVCISEYGRLSPVLGADFPGAKSKCFELAQLWQGLFAQWKDEGAADTVAWKGEFFHLIKESMRCAPFLPALMSEIEVGFENLLEIEFKVEDDARTVGTYTELHDDGVTPWGPSALW